MDKLKNIPVSPTGLLRVFGFSHEKGAAPRVWLGHLENSKGERIKRPNIKPDSIVNLRSAGNRITAVAFASDLKFS